MHNLLKILPIHQLNRIAFALLIFLFACEKEPGLPGNGANDNLELIDTLSFRSYTVLDDAKDALNEADIALGRLEDPRFGESIASFYMQLRLGILDFETGANPVLDSAILVLTIEDIYGPLENPIDWEVYRLTESLTTSEVYKSDEELSTDMTLIGGQNAFVYNEEQTLRIPLTQSFGEELLNLFGSTETENNDNFLAYLNGLYVTLNPNSGGDGLFDLDISNDNTQLELHFSSDNPDDSLYVFTTGIQALTVNRYQHDRVGSELETAINDLSNDDETLLIGGLTLSKGVIELPDLSFLSGNIINQARLSFYQADYGDALNTDYDNPEFLFLTGKIANDSSQYFLSDYSTSEPTAYGGTPELIDLNGNPTIQYAYNLPRFIQRYVNGDTEISSLNIEVLNFNNGNRVKLGGGISPDFPITLEILYSKP